MMTDVETLLSVDAGRTPPGTVAIFMDDGGDRRARLLLAVLAALMVVGAVGLSVALGRSGLAPITLLVLGAAMTAVRAMPTITDDDRPAGKRQVMVVTANGVIVRGAWGLKTWRFEDLEDVVAGSDAGRPTLELRDRNGSRYILECSGLRRCERARRVISSRLALAQPPRAYSRRSATV